MNKFKLGTRVKDIKTGEEGIIRYVCPEVKYPVIVRTKGKRLRTYTLDGKEYLNDSIPSLIVYKHSKLNCFKRSFKNIFG